MNQDLFSILLLDLDKGKGERIDLAGRSEYLGGSGLAAFLFDKYGDAALPWDDAGQPFILAIGPLTGLFPLMSKTVCAFKSPYHNQYTESHAGGRSALALKFAGYDALVLKGKAKQLSCVNIASRHIEIRETSFMAGMNAIAAGKLMRRIFRSNSGHRSILRIGQSGEIASAMACINVDTYRHFGRLGGGAVLGDKNIKGIIIEGDENYPLPESKEYPKLFQKVYEQVTETDMMRKYHNLGTPVNLEKLNEIQSLPWKNLQETSNPAVVNISGRKFADETLLRNGACSGCPVGCIHIGFVRELFDADDHRYTYQQVGYDYEPIFAAGTMLGVTEPSAVLKILDVMEKVCLDSMSAGVALAWATEAAERGFISEKETIVPLQFGDWQNYIKASEYLGTGINDFYRSLGQGTLVAAGEYGGSDFACVLGQEMAGYATGELFFAAQSLGFRHSHLDTGAYSYDQKNSEKDVAKAVDFLLKDEPGRCLLTSMVACLFGRKVFSDEMLQECLQSVGYTDCASNLPTLAENIRKHRWQIRFRTGFKPEDIVLPKRFYQVETWKGKVDAGYLDGLKKEYGNKLTELFKE